METGTNRSVMILTKPPYSALTDSIRNRLGSDQAVLYSEGLSCFLITTSMNWRRQTISSRGTSSRMR